MQLQRVLVFLFLVFLVTIYAVKQDKNSLKSGKMTAKSSTEDPLDGPMDEGSRKYMEAKKQAFEIYKKSLHFLKNNSNKFGVFETLSGLQYKVIKKGKGKFHPTGESDVIIDYVGFLTDGTKFDSSADRAAEFLTPVTANKIQNNIPKGWTEALTTRLHSF